MDLFSLAIVISAVDRASSTLKGVQGSLGGVASAAEKLGAVGQRAMVVGAAMTVAGNAIRREFVGAIESVMAPASAVEDSLNKVGSVVTPLSGTVEDAMGRMKTSALAWSEAHRDGATKFLDTSYMMISAGLNEQAAIEATRTAMLTARATMGDGAEAANLIATVYNNMGDKSAEAAGEIGRLGDVITKTQQTFQFQNLNQLTQGLTFGIPAAKQARLSFEQLSAVIGTLNSAGLQGSMAGTAFAAMLGNLNRASTDLGFSVARTSDGSLDFVATLASIEKRFGSLAEMTPDVTEKLRTAFGDEGFRGLSLMVGKSGELAKSLETVTKSAGSAATAAARMETGSSSFWEIFGNRITAVKVRIADQLTPALERLAPKVLEAVDAISTWLQQNPAVLQVFADAISEMANAAVELAPTISAAAKTTGEWVLKNPELTKTILKTVAAVGAILAVAGPVVIAIGAIAAAIAAIAASGVAGVVAAGIAIMLGWIVVYAFMAVRAWQNFKTIWTAVWSAVGSVASRVWSALSGFAFSLGSILVGAWLAATSKLSNLWDEVVSAFRENFFLGILTLLQNFNPAFWLLSALSGLPAIVAGAFNAVMAQLPAIWESLRSIFQVGIDILLGVLRLFTPLPLFEQAWASVSAWFAGISLFDSGVALLATFTAGIRSAANMPVEALKGVVGRMRNMLPFSPAREGPLKDLDRIRLVETIAERVRPRPLVAAMTAATAAAVSAVPAAMQASSAPRALAAPTRVMPFVEARAGGAQGGSGAGGLSALQPIQVSFNIDGDATPETVDKLEDWVRRNEHLIYSVVQAASRRAERGAFK